MNKLFAILVIVLGCASATQAQIVRRQLSGPSKPATCQSNAAVVDVFILKSGVPAVDGEYWCNAGLWVKDGGSGGSSGDVVGPASATNNNIALFDTTTGKAIKNSILTTHANGTIGVFGTPAAADVGVDFLRFDIGATIPAAITGYRTLLQANQSCDFCGPTGGWFEVYHGPTTPGTGGGSSPHNSVTGVVASANYNGTGREDFMTGILAVTDAYSPSGTGREVQDMVAVFASTNNNVLGGGTSQMRGVFSSIRSAAPINTFMRGIDIKLALASGAGTVPFMSGLHIDGWTNTSGFAPTLSYGIYIGSSIDVGATKYAIYSLSTSPTLLSGNLITTGLMQFGGATSSFPALARNGAQLRVVLADNSAMANLSLGTVTLGDQTLIAQSSNGVVRMVDGTGTSFGRLQLGGTTSSYPSIKRNAAGIDFRLADDSAFANVGLNNLTVNGTCTGCGGPSGLTIGKYTKATSATAIGNAGLSESGTTVSFPDTSWILSWGGGTSFSQVASGVQVNNGDLVAPGIRTTGGPAAFMSLNVGSVGGFLTRSAGVYGFTNGTDAGSTGGMDTTISRSAAGVVAFGTTAANSSGTIKVKSYTTDSNCADSAGAAACGSASAGAVVIDAGATTVVVSTTAVTADSEITIQEDGSLNTRLGVTCNTSIVRLYAVTARTPGTSFTITTSAAPVTNAACLNYKITN